MVMLHLTYFQRVVSELFDLTGKNLVGGVGIEPTMPEASDLQSGVIPLWPTTHYHIETHYVP